MKKKDLEIISKTLNFEEMDQINDNLAVLLVRKYPKMFHEVIEQETCDIDGTFLGFVGTYYFLSKIIPKDWDVIDFGCAYNPQSYYFRGHKSFIGVDPGDIKRFHFENTKLFTGTIKEYLAKNPPTSKVFAICNNVPSNETELVRQYYPNCYIYYTS